MKSSQKNAKPSIRQAMLLGGSLVLAGAAQAGMVTDQHGNVGYDSAAECDAAVQAGTARFYRPVTDRKPARKAGEASVRTIRLSELSSATVQAAGLRYSAADYARGACDLGIRHVKGRPDITPELVGKWVPFSPDMPLNLYSNAAGQPVRATMAQCDNGFSGNLPRPVPPAPTVAEQVVAPPQPLPNQCFANILQPARFETRSEQVLIAPATRREEVVPATYKTVTEQVLVQPETRRQVAVPAELSTVTENVVVRPAGVRDEPVPPTFKASTEQMVTREATQHVEVVPPVYRTEMTRVVDVPEHTIQRVVPAVYKEVEETVMVSPDTTRTEVAEPRYRTEVERVLVRPEVVRYVPVRLPMKQVPERRLRAEATTRIEAVPPVLQTVVEPVEVRPAAAVGVQLHRQLDRLAGGAAAAEHLDLALVVAAGVVGGERRLAHQVAHVLQQVALRMDAEMQPGDVVAPFDAAFRVQQDHAIGRRLDGGQEIGEALGAVARLLLFGPQRPGRAVGRLAPQAAQHGRCGGVGLAAPVDEAPATHRIDAPDDGRAQHHAGQRARPAEPPPADPAEDQQRQDEGKNPEGHDEDRVRNAGPTISGRGGRLRALQLCQRLRRQAVAGAAHGFDQHAGHAQRLAQALDMHVHRALLDEDVVAPHLVEQLAAAVHALGVLHEVVQQLELGRAHLQHLAVVRDAVRGRIQQQRPDGHRAAHLLGRAAAQHGADARQHLLGGEGLDDVVVGAGVQPGHAVGLVAARGQHQDGYGLGARVLAPFLGQRQAAFARQHPVEQDDVGQHGVQLALGGFAVHGPGGLEAVVPQVHGDQFCDGRLILDDEDAWHGSHCVIDSTCSSALWRTSVPLTM